MVMHAAFAPQRRPLMQRLEEALRPMLGKGDLLHVERDTERRGVWSVASACWTWGLSQPGVTHVVLLNDDALPCPGFVEAARAALSVRSQHPVCFYSGHEVARLAYEQGDAWWTSDDGLVSVACALPVELARDFLAWERESLVERPFPGISEDGRLNIWAMAHGRPIWHARGLVEHGAPTDSLVGNAGHDGRTSYTPLPRTEQEARDIDWTQGLDEPLHLLLHAPSPMHLLREVRPEVRERMGLEQVADRLWGEEAARCREIFGRVMPHPTR